MKQLPRKSPRHSPRPLVVRRETLRALGSIELARVCGGGVGAGTGPVDSCPPDQCAFGVG